jgi:hypothetical protein
MAEAGGKVRNLLKLVRDSAVTLCGQLAWGVAYE